MKNRQNAAPGREGAALIFSVMAVMVVSILAAGFLQLSLSITRRLSSSCDSVQALNLAEAGLTEAYTGLGQARTGNVGTPEQPAFFGGGLFWVEATTHSSGMVELECTAMYGTGRATLGMVCEPVAVGVASLGFFTLEDLRLNPNVRLDSYDSAQGAYADQINTPLNNQGSIGSNGDVSIASGNQIFGDVVYGPTGKVDLASGAIVTGGTSARPEFEELPPVEVPDIPLKSTAVKYTGGTPLVVAPGAAGYSSLAIGKDSKLVLKGPLTLVVGSFSLGLGAEMTFDTTDGPVEMYVTDSLDMATSAVVKTSTQVTSDAILMVSAPAGKTVNFGAKSQFYGFIYAPDAEVHMSAQYELYGGLVCKELRLAAQGKLHYDLALGATLKSLMPRMLAWRVVELPQVVARRTDPFQVLGLEPGALPSPAAAHEDQLLEVRYVAPDGTTDTYFGPESDFDWSLVQELLYGVRDGLAFFLLDDYASSGDIGVDPLVSLVDSSLSSKQLRDTLLAASPGVSSDALVAACERNPPLSASDLAAVLSANNPLDVATLTAALASAALDSSTLKGVLEANSPLDPSALAAVLTRSPPLSLSDLTSVLAKQ